MKFAAIDIGSNAIRFQITTVLESSRGIHFKKLEYLRFPMRLGEDVFTEGEISKQKAKKFIELMKAFRILIDLYEVDDYMACATSALREATNGKTVIKRVKQETNLAISIIDGGKEAKMINEALAGLIKNGDYLHIDVGGGSTELNYYSEGTLKASASFKIGSVRLLKENKIAEEWNKLEDWLFDHVKPSANKITAIGTGGNIAKLFELSGKKQGRTLGLNKLQSVQKYVTGISVNDRIVELQLNPDRADVIIPASSIYIDVMKKAKCSSILVPDVGLKDGIMVELYNRKKHALK